MSLSGIHEKLQVLDSPAKITTLSAIIYLIYILAILFFNNFSSSAFIWFGKEFVQEEYYTFHHVEKISENGYDGQFFYRLALNPFTRQKYEYGIKLDNPAYRHQRILYPLFVWMATAGSINMKIFGLVFLNFLSICGLAYICSKLLQKLGESAVWAVIFPLNPGFAVSISRSLCEPLAIMLLMLSLLFLIDKKYVISTACLALTVLARETTLLVAFALGIYWLFRLLNKNKKEDDHVPFYYFVTPMLAYASWQYYLFKIWGKLPVLAARGHNIGKPLQGLFSSISTFIAFQDISHPIYLFFILLICLFAAHCLLNLSKKHGIFSTILILYCFMALSYTVAIWSSHTSFFRALIEFNTIGILVTILSKSSFKYHMLLIWPLCWFLTAAIEIYIQARIPYL